MKMHIPLGILIPIVIYALFVSYTAEAMDYRDYRDSQIIQNQTNEIRVRMDNVENSMRVNSDRGGYSRLPRRTGKIYTPKGPMKWDPTHPHLFEYPSN